MRKFTLIAIILITLLLPLYALDIDQVGADLEGSIGNLVEDFLSMRNEDFSTLSYELVSIESDDELFEGKIYISSQLLFSNGGKNLLQPISFLVDLPEKITTEYLQRVKEILPSVLNSLYSLEGASNRLYYQKGALISGRVLQGQLKKGDFVVTRDSKDEINGMLQITDLVDNKVYLTSLWSHSEYSDYMKIEKGPSHFISIIPSISSTLVGLEMRYEKNFSISPLVVLFGINGEYDFTLSAPLIFLQGGFSTILPSSLFFSPSQASGWYQRLSLHAYTTFGVGVALNSGVQLSYQGQFGGILEYMVNPSLSIGAGVKWQLTAIMKQSTIADFEQKTSYVTVQPAITFRF